MPVSKVQFLKLFGNSSTSCIDVVVQLISRLITRRWRTTPSRSATWHCCRSELPPAAQLPIIQSWSWTLSMKHLTTLRLTFSFDFMKLRLDMFTVITLKRINTKYFKLCKYISAFSLMQTESSYTLPSISPNVWSVCRSVLIRIRVNRRCTCWQYPSLIYLGNLGSHSMQFMWSLLAPRKQVRNFWKI